MGSRLETGTLVGGFRVVSLIAEGATGAVHLAEDAAGRRVALKRLAPALARDERFRRRFLRESRLAASLSHPGIVPVVTSGEDEGTLYLAMTHVEGSDLREILRQEGRFDPERALRLLGEVAEALDAAHSAGLVHRDVKPSNILVAPAPGGERALVCDFGLARHLTSVGSLTGDRGFVGTIDYVSPEQIEGRTVDGRADVYSLGCVLYELLVGERPFERDSELAVIFSHLNAPPPRITDVRPELPEELDAVVATALAKSPDDRYPTAGELARAARAALRRDPIDRPRRRRRPAVLGLATAVAAVAVALAVVLATRETPPPAKAAITPASIAGTRLGLRLPDYKRLLGVGWREDVFKPPDFPVLIYFGRRLAIYFKHPGGGAVEVTTWNDAYRTAAGVGPCSTIVELKRAYGSRLKPSPANTIDGKVFAYTVGHMIFGANGKPPHPSTHVTAVAIFSGITLPYASFVALNEAACTSR